MRGYHDCCQRIENKLSLKTDFTEKSVELRVIQSDLKRFSPLLLPYTSMLYA